jgi:septal ring factor EnvC (AmiA/AmiB activator)
MDATAESTEVRPGKDYTSRPGALVWFFRKSRDQWKKKHQDLKATVKRFKNQVAAVTKSREQWRLQAEQANERVSELEAVIAGLRAQVGGREEKKKRMTEAVQ